MLRLPLFNCGKVTEALSVVVVSSNMKLTILKFVSPAYSDVINVYMMVPSNDCLQRT